LGSPLLIACLLHAIEAIRKSTMVGHVSLDERIIPRGCGAGPSMETARGFSGERTMIKLVENRSTEDRAILMVSAAV
jgi:hypothetical protein